MKYIYRILAHDAENAIFQVKLSCLDTPNSGVVNMPYPTVNGEPTFSKSKVLEYVMTYFRTDLTNWEVKENNKDKYEEIQNEAEAMVGTSVSFDHSILDDSWLAEDIE